LSGHTRRQTDRQTRTQPTDCSTRPLKRCR